MDPNMAGELMASCTTSTKVEGSSEEVARMMAACRECDHLYISVTSILITLTAFLLKSLLFLRLAFFKIIFLLLLFDSTTQAAVTTQENLDQIATEVNDWWEKAVLIGVLLSAIHSMVNEPQAGRRLVHVLLIRGLFVYFDLKGNSSWLVAAPLALASSWSYRHDIPDLLVDTICGAFFDNSLLDYFNSRYQYPYDLWHSIDDLADLLAK